MELLATLVHGVLYLVGGAAVAMFVLWVVTVPFFLLLKEKLLDVRASIDEPEMPLLQPLPIKTAGQKSGFRRMLVYFHVPRTWMLQQNWHWTYREADGTTVELVVPKGFACDVASIPRPFRALFNPCGLLLLPSILHDYAFKHNQLWKHEDGEFLPYRPDALCCDKEAKRYWDDLLFRAGEQINGSMFINGFIRMLGRVGFSSGTWKGYREARRRGEIRTEKPLLENSPARAR